MHLCSFKTNPWERGDAFFGESNFNYSVKRSRRAIMLEPQVSKGSAPTIRTKQMKALKNGRVQPRVELARTSDNGRADHTRFSRKNNRDNKDNI